MKQSFLFVLLALVAMPAFGAKELKCSASDDSNQNRKPVAVTAVAGAEVVEEVESVYGSNKITVVYNRGDQFDRQTVLTIRVNDYTSRVYNVSEKGLYQMLTKGLMLQCSFQ